jgi:hypothetical protein
MRIARSVSFVFVFVAVTAASAVAQQVPAPVESPVRGYLVVGAGAVSGIGQTSPTFSAELGDHVMPNVQVYASLTYHDNLMSETARQHLVDVGQSLSTVTGTPWNFQGRDRAWALTAGAKYLFGDSPVVRPYVGAGLGVINLERVVREQSRGNLTAAFLSEFGSGDGLVDATQEDVVKPLGEVAAGLGVVAGRAYFDFGYRYRTAFHNVGDSLEFSQFIGSVGVKF